MGMDRCTHIKVSQSKLGMQVTSDHRESYRKKAPGPARGFIIPRDLRIDSLQRAVRREECGPMAARYLHTLS